MSNPVQYTSRTYLSILADINADADLADKPEWWKRIWAGIGDVLSVYLNAEANNLFLGTAFTRQAVTDLCALIDYQLGERSTSSGVVLFFLVSGVSFPKTLTLANLAAQTAGSLAVAAKRFEARASVVVSSQETGTFTADHTTERLTVTRVFVTGEKVRLTTTGTLPAGLALVTDYYAIYVSDTIIKLADSLANAYTGTVVAFTDNGSGTHSWNLLSVRVTMYQQRTTDQYVAGRSDGATEWQEFDLGDKFVVRDTLVVTINSVQWTVLGTGSLADTFVFSDPTDKHVRILYNADETAKLQFGDGTYGEIPGNFDVYVDYAVGGGSDANAAAERVTIYAGSDTDVEAVSNTAAMTGGSDAESIETARILAPLLLKARDRFVTAEDGEALVLAYGGLTQTRVNTNAFGVLSAQVVAVAAGGGNPSGAVKTALQQYLIDRSILESMDIRVEDATITATAVTSAGKVLAGYSWSGSVSGYFRLGWELFLTETGREILTEYDTNGVAAATTLINTIFGESFGAADAGQVTAYLEALTARSFGETIQESDAFGFIDANCIGLDYMTITVPSFPIALADDEIATDGTLTLTEI